MAGITTAICDSFKQEALDGVHLAADEYRIALIKPSPTGTFGQATTNYSELGADEVAAGNGYTQGAKVLAGRVSSLANHVAFLNFTNPVWANSTIVASGALIFNATRGNKAVAVYLFTNAPVTSTNGNFTGTMPAADSANAVVRLA